MNVGWLETSFAVADVARTSAWYEALGFQLVETNDAGMTRTLQAGSDCRLALYQGVLDPPESQLIFWQGDVEACARALIEAGAEIVRQSNRAALDRGDGLVVTPEGVSILARDPDGQLIFLINQKGVTRTEIAPPACADDLDRGFFQVSLPVKDPDRTAAFYELLGFRRRANDDP